MKTRWLTGDVNWRQYGGRWVTKKLSNGEFDYWLVIDFINYEDATGEKARAGKYIIEVRAVSITEAGIDNLAQALQCCGFALEDVKDSEICMVEALDSYGVHALMQTFQGNNAYKLLKEARKQLDMMNGLFGFYMDPAKNRLGHTGWDCIKGDLSIETAIKNRDEYLARHGGDKNDQDI